MTQKPCNFKLVYKTSMVEPLHLDRTRYTSRKVAQNAADRINKRNKKYGGDKLVVYSLDEYAAAVKGKGEWKVSPFTGAKVWVDLGTPACCDPTTETYMSM